MSLAAELRAAATQCDRQALEALERGKVLAARDNLEAARLFDQRANQGRTVVDDMVDTRVRELMDALADIAAACSAALETGIPNAAIAALLKDIRSTAQKALQ